MKHSTEQKKYNCRHSKIWQTLIFVTLKQSKMCSLKACNFCHCSCLYKKLDDKQYQYVSYNTTNLYCEVQTIKIYKNLAYYDC